LLGAETQKVPVPVSLMILVEPVVTTEKLKFVVFSASGLAL